MEVIYINDKNRKTYLSNADPCVIALGFFDGIHLGHQQVINKAKKIAGEKNLMLACMSFFPHPKEVLKKGKETVQYLMPMIQKQRILKELGVEKFYIIQFDAEFASSTPKQFVKKYLIDFGAKCVVAGFDYTYGRFGKGHMDRMREDSADKIEVIKVEKVDFNGEKISSTLIRETISSGKMEQVHRYLGNHYQIEGEIILNQNMVEAVAKPYYLLPPPGIYDVIVSAGIETIKQVVLVTKESNNLIFAATNSSLLKRSQDIQIKWIKRLPPGMFTPLEQLYFISEGVI